MRSHARLCAAALMLLGSIRVLAATPAFAVGSCKPSLTSFNSISQAVSIVPGGSIVFVCPGNYPEQVKITQPLTLQGVMIGGSNAAVVSVPAGNMAINASDGSGNPVGAQILVGSTGPVTINDLIVDGSGGSVGGCPNSLVGVFYQSSSGTLSHSVIRNLSDFCSDGVLLENDDPSSSPTVSIVNSSVHDIAALGIYATTGPSAQNLTVNIQSNSIGNNSSATGLLIYQSAGGTVTNNIVDNLATGIVVQGNATSVKGNRVANTSGGIVVVTAGNTVQSNTVVNTKGVGISLLSNSNQILANTVTNSSTGIGFYCTLATSGNIATGNLITEANTAIANNGITGNTVSPNQTFAVTSAVGPCL